MNSTYLDKWDLWPFTYNYRVRLSTPGTPGDSLLRFPLPIQGDADFVWRAFQIDIMNPAPADLNDFIGVNPTSSFCQNSSIPLVTPPPVGAYRFSYVLRLPADHAIHNGHVMAGAASLGQWIPGNVSNNGNACYPQPIIPEVLLLRGTALTIDLRNLTNVNNVGAPDSSLELEIALRGVKLIPKGYSFQIDRTKKYLGLPAVYQSPLPSTVPGTYTPSNVVLLESNTQFLLYSIDCDAQNTGFQMTIYGPHGERTSPLNVPGNRYGLVSRGNYCGTSRFPGVVCPPMAFPAGGAILFDFYAPLGYAAQNSKAQIAFRGSKLYDVGGKA